MPSALHQDAFEFRNATGSRIVSTKRFDQRMSALCLAENENLETPHVSTADFVYLRLRKPDYTESELTASLTALSSIGRTSIRFTPSSSTKTRQRRIECGAVARKNDGDPIRIERQTGLNPLLIRNPVISVPLNVAYSR